MTAPVAPPPFRPDAPPPSSAPLPDPSPRPDRGPLIQRVLLGAGALCVLVAGAVYLAVSWHRIGTAGQAGLALVVTTLAAAAAHLLARRGLRASAETFALVAAGLLALDLAGAHHLDVLGAARLEWWAWLTIAVGVVLAVCSALSLLDRLLAYRTVAVVALAVLPYTGLLAAERAGLAGSSGLATTVAALVGTGLVALAARLGRRDAVSGAAAVAAAAAWWLVAVSAGVDAGWSDRPCADVLPATLTWAAVAVTLLVLAGRAVAAGRTGSDARIVLSVAGPVAAAPGALVLAGSITAAGPVATLVVAAGVATVWATRWAAVPAGRPLALGAAVAVLALVPAAAGRSFGTDVVGTLVLLVGATALGALAHGRGATRVVAGVVASASAVVGVVLLAVDRDQPAVWVTAAWAAVAVVAVLTATFVGPAREGLLAVGITFGTLAVAAGLIAQALDTRTPVLASALLGLGAAALVHGGVRTSRAGVLTGAAAIAAAGMDLAVVARVEAVEAYSLPIAAVVLLAGVLSRIGRPELSSWTWAAPAVLVAVVPSAQTALSDPGVTRLVLTATFAAAVTVAGLRFRLAAPLLLGAATEAVLAVSQLAPYAVGTPRWVTLALAGVLLLTLGVLFERARRGAAAAGRWYTALR